MNNKQVAAHIDEVWCSQLIVLYTDDHRYVKLCAFNWKEAGGPHSSSAHTAAHWSRRSNNKYFTVRTDFFFNYFILFEILLQTYDQLQEKASVSHS